MSYVLDARKIPWVAIFGYVQDFIIAVRGKRVLQAISGQDFLAAFDISAWEEEATILQDWLRSNTVNWSFGKGLEFGAYTNHPGVATQQFNDSWPPPAIFFSPLPGPGDIFEGIFQGNEIKFHDGFYTVLLRSALPQSSRKIRLDCRNANGQKIQKRIK